MMQVEGTHASQQDPDHERIVSSIPLLCFFKNSKCKQSIPSVLIVIWIHTYQHTWISMKFGARFLKNLPLLSKKKKKKTTTTTKNKQAKESEREFEARFLQIAHSKQHVDSKLKSILKLFHVSKTLITINIIKQQQRN